MSRTKWGGATLEDAIISAYHCVQRLAIPYRNQKEYIDLVPQAFWLAWVSYCRLKDKSRTFESYLYYYLYYYFLSHRRQQYSIIKREINFDPQDRETFPQEINQYHFEVPDVQRQVVLLTSFYEILNEDGKWALVTILKNHNTIIGHSTFGFPHYIRSTVRNIWIKEGGWSRWRCDKVMRHMKEIYKKIYEQ